MDDHTIHLVNLIPGTLVDDFFFFGFVGGVVGYMWYQFTNRNDEKNHVNFITSLYGTILSGALGGLLAIVFDRDIRLSIVIGLLNQLVYMAMVKAAKSGDATQVLKDVLVRYLTGGKGIK